MLASERGISLRSRCNLRPTQPRVWEALSLPGEPVKSYSVTGEQATDLLNKAVTAAKVAGLKWMEETLRLKPSKELVDLIPREPGKDGGGGRVGGRMIALGLRYLTKYAVATDLSRQRAVASHPGRIYMAMAAAHFESGSDAGERAALEWLEAANPPAMRVSCAYERSLVGRMCR